ncbi:TrkA family potassium uptake protein [Herbiconiux sp.]|uniref:potassium channel family protein n=1 Tax=Herbiconiux sp. TaxID=1871186 RepID=UPI0025C452F1|nr:TrkA family potassium uptake protein [Herbiconiux sp.]
MARTFSSKRPRGVDSVAVIGLGRFGRALATELAESGTEVLGIDTDEDIVQSLNGVLTHVVRADTTREGVLDQLGIDDFDRVVIGIGTDLQASILTASLLKRRGTTEIWAKAVSDQHGLILEQIGVEHVVYPESDMGRRVAHLVRGGMLDFLAVEKDFVMAKTTTPAEVVGQTLTQARIRDRYSVTVVAVRQDDRWTYATGDTVLVAGQRLLVLGPTDKTEKFAALPR